MELTGRDILRAYATPRVGRSGEEPGDAVIMRLLANLEAMTWASNSVAPGGAITVDALLKIHRLFMADGRLGECPGALRSVQIWVQGNAYGPRSAPYVPPPPERVPELLEDLCAFCNEDSLPTVVMAAMAHAQFETIHPFEDGNGRVGRALIQMILRRRGLARRAPLPISRILALRSQDYIGGLTGLRYVGEPDCREAEAGIDGWIALFAAACSRAARDALGFEKRIEAVKASWRDRVGPARSDSTAALLIEALPTVPVLTVTTAAELVNSSYKPASEAVTRLVQAGVLSQLNAWRRNRLFEATDIVDAFGAFLRPSAADRYGQIGIDSTGQRPGPLRQSGAA